MMSGNEIEKKAKIQNQAWCLIFNCEVSRKMFLVTVAESKLSFKGQ